MLVNVTDTLKTPVFKVSGQWALGRNFSVTFGKTFLGRLDMIYHNC